MIQIELPDDFYTENLLGNLSFFARKRGFELKDKQLIKEGLTYILRNHGDSFHLWGEGGAKVYRVSIFKNKIDSGTRVLELRENMIYETYNEDACNKVLYESKVLWFDENEELLKRFFEQKSKTLTNIYCFESSCERTSSKNLSP